jgi:hypothetical protein
MMSEKEIRDSLHSVEAHIEAVNKDFDRMLSTVNRCSECGGEIEVGDWPFCNGNPARHVPADGRFAAGFDPVVIHRDAAGNIRYPANIHAPVPEGYQKVELRTVSEVRRFEAEVNQREHVKADQHHSAREAAFAAAQSIRRSDLRGKMRNMSAFGQDFARHAMERTDSSRPQPRDVGFHLDVFSNDSSNRETHRDARTDWKGRKG